VPAALFLAARDEAEFAALLAHGMQHVALRHGLRQSTPSGQFATVPLIFLGGWPTGSAGFAIPAGFALEQRKLELDADAHAVESLAAAGFDPAALLRYLARVQADTPVSKTVSPLPTKEERLAALRSRIGQIAAKPYEAGSPEFLRLQGEVRRVKEAPARIVPPALKRPGER
jgi:predicted Zn-dependent protease